MKDVMVVSQVMNGSDAARINVGLGDSEASGDSFEAALNQQLTHGEQPSAEQAEPAASAASTSSGATSVAAPAEEATVSDELPVETLDPVDELMAALLPVAVEPTIPENGVDRGGDGVVAGTVVKATPVNAPLVVEPAMNAPLVTAAPAVGTLVPGTVAAQTPEPTAAAPRATSGVKDAATMPVPAVQLATQGLDGAAAEEPPLGAQREAHLPVRPAHAGPVGTPAASIKSTRNGADPQPSVDHRNNAASSGEEAIRRVLAAKAPDGAGRSSEALAAAPGASFASALGAMAQARMDTGAPQSLEARALPPLDAAIESSEWGSGLGSRIVWGLANVLRAATLAVHPRELGPVTIQLSMGEDEASIHFTSQHVMVREAIEAALPRLREALASEGIRLGDVAVGGGGESGAGDADARAGRSSEDTLSQSRADSAAAASSVAESRSRVIDGLVDTFA